ncbi:MAG: hypothetical protein ABI640_16750 [Gammaproteobacteria bacterium]
MLKPVLAIACLFSPAAAVHAEGESDTHLWTTGIEVGIARPSSSLTSWLDGGVGKLRYSNDDRGLVADRWYAEYRGRVGESWSLHATADAVDDATSGFGVTEAYAEWRQIPHSPNRQRLKLGFFNAPWSLENSGPAWSTPLTLSSSAVNTWIGEEVRPLGAEWSLKRRLSFDAAQQFSLHAALFYGNDPAGSLLAWKGWSVHDRQSRYGDRLPLAPLPLLQPGAMFDKQSAYVAPWREVDGRAGYYLGGGWRYAQRVELTLAHYDNRADPTQIERGQYAWHTGFEQFGVQIDLPKDFGLTAQWMQGTTVMGPVLVTTHAVDTTFEAHYVLVTKLLGKHRITLRRDSFAVIDRDGVPRDDNSDAGEAWTLAYRYERSARWSLGAEWLGINSWHPAWQYLGLPTRASEELFQVRLSLSFGTARRGD